jgi:uncharacterized membrane protein YfcA
MDHIFSLAVLIFITAILYSSVGHAGASGYLAAMALMNVPAEVMKPTALVLNVAVGTIATIRFAHAGFFSWSVFWPFAIASIPFSFLGGAIRLPSHYYRTAVGVVLLFAAVRLLFSAIKKDQPKTKRVPVLAALIAGAAIGFLAGLTGTGGAIFLSPLLLLAHWADVRECAGVSAAFVLTNSIAGLAGNLASVHSLPAQISYLAVTAVVGGIIGSELGSRRLAPVVLRYLLAAVLTVASCKMIFT